MTRRTLKALVIFLAVLAALLHVYIWVLESFRWTEPATRKTFGVSERDAPVLAPMAYNQGFYNLFLAIITVVGLALLGTDGGIMVTASHNPPDYNGMKFVREGSRPISADTGLNAIRDLVATQSLPAAAASNRHRPAPPCGRSALMVQSWRKLAR